MTDIEFRQELKKTILLILNEQGPTGGEQLRRAVGFENGICFGRQLFSDLTAELIEQKKIVDDVKNWRHTFSAIKGVR